MSDTPRTNEVAYDVGGFRHEDGAIVESHFSRQLERELNASKADADSWREQAERFGQQLLDANERIKRLEEAGDAMTFWCADEVSLEQWNNAKQ